MLDTIVGWIKGLFSGKGGTTQIGKGNQAVTGSTTGNNSPVVTAGGDVQFFNMPQASRDTEEDDAFAGLEELMPDFLNELRNDLATHPLIREFIVMESATSGVNIRDDHLRFNRADDPQIMNKVKILENCGLVFDHKGNRLIFRMSERFVRFLTQKRADA